MQSDGASRKRNLVLLAIAAAPVLGSLIAASQPSTARVVSGATPPRSLVFEQYFVDLGPHPIQPRPIAYARFAMTNRGTEPVEIRDLDPSCGCLMPLLDRQTIAPGENAEIVMRVQTTSQEPGQHEYILKVRYADPRPREVDLGFKLVLPERQLVVRPRSLVFHQHGTDTITHSATLTDFRSQKINVLDIESDSEFVSATVGPSVDTDQGTREYRIDVSVPGDMAAGRHRAIVSIHTDDPQQSLVQIPIIVEGPADGETRAADIHANPRELLMAGAKNQTATGSILINSHSAVPVDSVKCTASPEFLDAELHEVPVENSSGWHAVIAVTARSNRPDTESRGIVRLISEGSDTPLLEIPVVVRNVGGPAAERR